VAGPVVAILLWLLASGRLTLPRWAPLRWLAFFGVRAYSIYLTHYLVGARVLNLANHLPNLSPAGAVGLFVVAVAASLLFACLFYALVEVPLMSQARKVTYRN
jgi:peptidoglycan/LPS O-acetylase OafA/YrhL